MYNPKLKYLSLRKINKKHWPFEYRPSFKWVTYTSRDLQRNTSYYVPPIPQKQWAQDPSLISTEFHRAGERI